ncbi:MAG: flagellar protein FlaG [Nitrospirae bacterium]|nr:flagellar protein FlaG [Nitrospirota bacterium]
MIEDIVKTNNFNNASTVDTKFKNNSDTANKKAEKTDNAEHVKDYANKRVQEAIEHIVKSAGYFNRKIKVEVDQDTVVVKVIDGDTGDVIRQIPPKELIELSKNAKDLKGLLINKEG